MQERIACAAIWYKNAVYRGKFSDGDGRFPHQPRNIKKGVVVCGLRHCNCLGILVALFPGREYILDRPKASVQGFLTTKNRFVSRKVADKIAQAAGQISGPAPHYDGLHSEDMY